MKVSARSISVLLDRHGVLPVVCLAAELKVNKLWPLVVRALHLNFVVVVGVDDRIKLLSVKEVPLHHELQINVLIVLDKSNFVSA